MSGYDDLQRGIAAVNELGMDDPGGQEALWSAIKSGDLAAPDAGSAYGLLGSCYHATGRQEEAVECLEQGIKLCDDRTRLAMMHHDLGETLFVLEREAEAEPHYRRSLELDREHSFAPDTLALLARAIYFRSDGDPKLLEESYQAYAESLALWESPQSDRYLAFHSTEKAVFDDLFGMAVCKSEMPNDNERFEATELFERAEQQGLNYREAITDNEITNVYRCWIALLVDMGLERDAQLIAERASRAI